MAPRPLITVLFGCLLVLSSTSSVRAQSGSWNAHEPGPGGFPKSQTSPQVPSTGFRNQLTLDLDVLGAGLTYARRVGANRYSGVDAGLGGGALNVMLFAGPHFSQSWGLSYGGHDGYGKKFLFELAHVGGFYRWADLGRWTIEMGLRGAVFLHSDSSDDDPGGGYFLGLNSGTYWGSERWRVGWRLLAGVFAETHSKEFGVLLVPLTGRIAVRW